MRVAVDIESDLNRRPIVAPAVTRFTHDVVVGAYIAVVAASELTALRAIAVAPFVSFEHAVSTYR